MRISSFPLAFGLLLSGCIAFVAMAWGEHLSLQELARRSDAQAHALQTQLQVRKVGALLVDIETGQRGFIITGQSAFLEPYEQARLDLARSYGELKIRLMQGEAPPPSTAALEALITRRIAQVERNVALRWQQGEAVLKDLSGYVSGKQLMDEIRHELARLEAQQAALVKQTQAETAIVRKRTTELASLLSGVGVLLIAGALLALLLERRRRDRAEQALLAANSHLESTVAERTAALSAALARIQSFTAELDRGIEAERRELAREVHDQMGQIGTATKMLVLALRKKLAPAKEEMLDELLTLADEMIMVARQISATLRPPLLDDLGLAAAVAHYAKTLERQGELAVQLDLRDEDRLSAEQRNQLFRILQEATTNVLRHARASRLRIAGQAGDSSYGLVIEDDGVGPGPVRPDASGLRNMRERASLAGGSLQFGPGHEGGSRIDVCLPLAVRRLGEEVEG
ncbi:hypothetical protein G8A07_06695 [Roseateles sp. DAIF2]|uniref:CHASE3 domain-containing protein n=1 Tax=Roseateles sp. DAIF2 TaxID=2714952 RepID=UPI0018A3350A|nr:CHASE3 domain-containing protein [Roseateles sp. DAIF2]QPF72645.1 hypothetical protein G8A07_06695 [Roseateles sp. DAIF2]